MSYVFSKREAIKVGWDITKNHLGLLVGATVIFIGLSFLLAVLGSQLESIEFVVSLITWIVQLLMTLGFITISLKLLSGQQAEIKDLFSNKSKLVSAVGAFALIALINLAVFGLFFVIMFVLFGSTLLQLTQGVLSINVLLPAMLFLIAFLVLIVWINLILSFFTYSIVDENTRAVDSLRRSKELTKGSRWNIFFLQVLLGLINSVGGLLIGLGVLTLFINTSLGTTLMVIGGILLLGMLVTFPLSMVALTHVYQKLKHARGGLPTVESAQRSVAERADVSPTHPAERPEETDNTYKLS